MTAAKKATNASANRKPSARKPTGVKKARQPAKPKVRSGKADDGVPAYEAAAVGRVATRVQIENVELVHAHFERLDDGPRPLSTPPSFVPEIGLDFDWEVDDAGELLGCLFRFGAYKDDGDDQPYRLFAHFRLLYSVRNAGELDSGDIHQFVAWNAMFNAWPYWREYLSSTVNRAGLPRVTLPVMGVPRSSSEQ